MSCTSSCTDGSDFRYTHSSSKLCIRKRNYIYSFIPLYSLQVKSLHTHTHATSVPSLRGNWVLKDKSYLVYDNTVILYNYYYTQSNSSCSCVFLWNKCSKTSLMQKIFSQLSLPLVGLRFWSINPLSSAFVEFKPTWIK